MAKKDKKIAPVDFHTGIGEIIPSTQEAYQNGSFSKSVRKEEKESLVQFKQTLGTKINQGLVQSEQFPTDYEVFVFIIQYFVSEKEYDRRDIDNMAKTILDVLKGRLYSDDSQVKTLLVGKKMEKRVPQNFAYVAIKELKGKQDVDALKISGLERSVTLFQELTRQGIL